MCDLSTCATPLIKQSFLTVGVALNMASVGIGAAYAGVILPQLQAPDSAIPLDDSSASWIAAIVGLTQIGGTFVAPPIMGHYGRKLANMLSIFVMIAAWICIATAKTIPAILCGRSIHGIGLGMTYSVGPTLIGEYTSPRNRGAFLALTSVIKSLGVLVVHTIGLYLTWQMTAVVCTIIALVDLLIVILSPESPSWLIDKGKYEDGKKVFRWLRGDNEEEELQKMIEANIALRKSKTITIESQSLSKKIKNRITFFINTIRKKEFYKPIFIIFHIIIILEWGGANFTSSYITDLIRNIIGSNVDVAAVIISLATQRLISNAFSVYIIKKVRRRVMLFVTVGLSVIVYLVTAGYTFAKAKNILPFDHPAIGIVLIHLHMFSIATGSLPLPIVIAGEIFPLEYRSLESGISSLLFAVTFAISVKTFPFLNKSMGTYGAYTLYGGIVGYCLFIAWMFLPETKDRTLQDIEDEFRGRPLCPGDSKSTQSLNCQQSQKA